MPQAVFAAGHPDIAFPAAYGFNPAGRRKSRRYRIEGYRLIGADVKRSVVKTIKYIRIYTIGNYHGAGGNAAAVSPGISVISSITYRHPIHFAPDYNRGV